MKFKAKSLIAAVMKDIYKEDKDLRKKAALHIKRKIRGKIVKKQISEPHEAPGQVTGNLLRSLTVKSYKTVALVGFRTGSKKQTKDGRYTDAGYHASILEFGTKERLTSGGRNRGRMEDRPILSSTFAEEVGAVKQIMFQPRD